MERCGYVTRGADADDQRARRIALAPRGRDAVRAIRAIVREVEDEWAARLGTERFAELDGAGSGPARQALRGERPATCA